MDRNTLQERRKHFLAFVTALVMVFTMLPMWTDAYGDDGSGSESDEPACEHKNTILIPYEGQKATCVEGCLGYKYCNDCEQIDEEVEIPINLNNHVGSEKSAGNAKEATCVEEGYTGDILCDKCNTVWKGGSVIPINPTNHAGSKTSAGNAKDATCVAKGYTGDILCSECKEIWEKGEEIKINPNNHAGSKISAGNAKDATCVAKGYTGDILCSECKEIWEKGEEIKINSNNHVGSKVSAGNAKDANCVEKGYTGDILCDECNNVWEKGEEIPIDKTKHAGPIVDAGNAKEASCTEEGYTGDKKCQACGTVTETGKKIDKEPHDWDEGTITTAATCIAKGVITYKCKNCGAEKPEKGEAPIDKTNHVHTAVVGQKEATCTAEGYTGDTKCSDCGTVIEQGKAIAKKAHELDDGTVTKEATCSATGVRTYKCKNCEYTETEEIPIDKTNHVGPIIDAGNAKEASCTEEGYTGDKKCQACGTVTEQGKAIAKKAHELDDGTVTKEATCSATGVRTYKCKNCEYTETEEIPINKDAHDWDDGVVTKEPTCSATGEKLYTCKLNSSHTKTEVIPTDKSKHTAGETKKENIKLPTCTVKGSHEENVYCKYCNVAMFVKSVIDEALGHKLVHHPAKDATADVEGNKEYWECTVCGKIFIDQDGKTETSLQEVTIPKLSEDPEEGKKTLVHVEGAEATCDAAGTKEYWMDPDSGKKYSDAAGTTEMTDADLVIPMKEHVRETVPGKAATCTESGLTDGVKCSECGEILVAQEKIPALGHDFEEWKIIMKPTITTGGILRRTCKRPGCLFTEEMREDATGKVGNVYTVGHCTYTITDMKNLTVSLTGWNGKGTAFAVPDTVTIGGAKFTVTGIGAGAFAGNGKYYLTIINPTQALTTDPTTLGLVISRIQKEENVVISQVAVNTSDNTDDSSNDGDQSDSTGNVSASENAIDRTLKGMNSNSKQNVFEFINQNNDLIKQKNSLTKQLENTHKPLNLNSRAELRTTH